MVEVDLKVVAAVVVEAVGDLAEEDLKVIFKIQHGITEADKVTGAIRVDKEVMVEDLGHNKVGHGTNKHNGDLKEVTVDKNNLMFVYYNITKYVFHIVLCSSNVFLQVTTKVHGDQVLTILETITNKVMEVELSEITTSNKDLHLTVSNVFTLYNRPIFFY